MTRIEDADRYFSLGYSCSQSILMAFGPSFQLNPEDAVRLGRSFGSGMGQGDTCGAVTGAFMVLGLSCDGAETEKQARYAAYNRIKDFVEQFEMRHGSIVCRALLDGVDLGTQRGQIKARELNLFKTVCPAFVHSSAEFLDRMLGQ